MVLVMVGMVLIVIVMNISISISTSCIMANYYSLWSVYSQWISIMNEYN